MLKRSITALAVLFALLTSMCGCSNNKNEFLTKDYVNMDTVFSIRIGKISDSTGDSANELFNRCEALTDEIENVLSTSIPGSDAESLNQQIDALLDADSIFTNVLSFALELSDITGESFDPVLGALTSIWNVKGGGPVPDSDKISAAMEAEGVQVKHSLSEHRCL